MFIFQLAATIFFLISCSCHDKQRDHHFFAHRYFSLNAATPGSSLPSSNSSDAPPPVEMKVILSASPACLTAVTESPPPMMVVAPDCAIASAIAIVPSPN